MGNCFQRLWGEDSPHSEYGGHGYVYEAAPVGAGPSENAVEGYAAVARDLLAFETTNKVPELLGYYVSASKATQRIWFKKLLVAWKRENPAPASAKAVAILIIHTLQDYYSVQSLLRFYHLPWPTIPLSRPVPEVIKPEFTKPEFTKPEFIKPEFIKPEVTKPEVTKPEVTKPGGSGTWLVKPASAEAIQFEIFTLPVKWKENVGDGDGFTVFVDVGKDPREARDVPQKIKDAVRGRQVARAQKNFQAEMALRKLIEADGEYKMFDGKNGRASCLAHKYRIRLRGVDAPEIGQHYGEEARDILRNLVKDQQLVIHVYGIDKYDRAVGDVYCLGTFIQEELLKRGSVWHFEYHDKRAKFAQLHRAARAARLGLWAHPNPKEPWDWRADRQNRLKGKNGGRSFGKQRGG